MKPRSKPAEQFTNSAYVVVFVIEQFLTGSGGPRFRCKRRIQRGIKVQNELRILTWGDDMVETRYFLIANAVNPDAG